MRKFRLGTKIAKNTIKNTLFENLFHFLSKKSYVEKIKQIRKMKMKQKLKQVFFEFLYVQNAQTGVS